MKRKNYKIYINGEHVDTRHTWNAARRNVAKLILSRLNITERAESRGFHYERDMNGEHAIGLESWYCSNGRVFDVKIEKEQDRD